MEYEWLGVAIAITSVLSSIAIGILKFAFSMDVLKYKNKHISERKNVLRNLANKMEQNSEPDEIEKILESTNNKLVEFDKANRLIDDYSDSLIKAIQGAIIGFVSIIVASIVETGDFQTTCLMIGGLAYFFGFIMLADGVNKCHQAHKNYMDTMVER
jgi:ABC-type transport system involved in cytochrome bd biosynthesis fused ATPase/permease subunit